ncbi:hypothetical protein [Treponema sp.]|uniref:hypothetical protein n=1 Tax=Treponema sp. TaxID=166 RepID=UPI0025E891D3|nr:hypothetical protein [Treponema sp.]MCR5217932.1 hypothetical protein [Treponema sp.]
MKKSAVLALSALFTVSAFSLETKGIISNESQLSFSENDYSVPSLVQKDSLTASLRQPLSQSGKTYFSAEAMVSFEYDRTFSDPAYDDTEILADLTLFKLASKIPVNKANFCIAAGRFSMADATSRIYNQNADGILLQYLSPYIELNAYGAYTGLLNAKTVTILTPVASAYGSNSDKDFYDFATAYIAGALSIKFPYLLFNQSITAECFAFISTEGPGEMTAEDDKRIYGTLALDGPLSSSFFYNASTSFLFSEEMDYKAANYSAIKADIFPSESFMLSVSGCYASGKQGAFEAFTTFTASTAGLNVSEKKYNALAMGGLACAARISPEVILNLGGDILFDIPETEAEYSGTQVSAALTYQAFTDLSLSLSAQTFIADKEEESKSTFKLMLSLAF